MLNLSFFLFSSWAGKRSAPSVEAGEEEDEQPMMMESHRYKRSSGEAEDTDGVSEILIL